MSIGAGARRRRASWARRVGWAAVACAAAVGGQGCVRAAPQRAEEGGGHSLQQAESSLASAATAPLADLNVVRDAIPEVLVAARKAPYARPTGAGCEALAAQVHELDTALGPDLDVPTTTADPGLIERGADTLGEEVVGAVRNTAEGVLPFRGWVRRLSGAQRHSREVAAAIAAGTVRRAYLKGLGQALGCAAPAAPAGLGAPAAPASGPPAAP